MSFAEQRELLFADADQNIINNRTRDSNETEIEKLRETRKQRIRDCLITVEETKQIGTETMVQMVENSESLNRIDSSCDNIDIELNKGERILRSFTFFGRVKNFFTRDQSLVPFQPKNEENRKQNVKQVKHVDMPRAAKNKEPNEQTCEMDALHGGILDLKQMALDMGEMIETDGKKLEIIETKVERSNERTNKMNFKIWKKL